MYYNLSLDILSNLTNRSWYSWSLYSWERKTKSLIYICNTKIGGRLLFTFLIVLKIFWNNWGNWTHKALYSDVMYDNKYREKIWPKDFKFICWTDVIENTRTIGYITNLFHNRRGANISRLIPEKNYPPNKLIYGNQVCVLGPNGARQYMVNLRQPGLLWKWSFFCYQSSFFSHITWPRTQRERENTPNRTCNCNLHALWEHNKSFKLTLV